MEGDPLSTTLCQGHSCTIFLAFFLMVLFLIMVPFLMVPINDKICRIPVVGFLWSITVQPQISVLGTVLFFSLRVEKEGLNIHSLRDELGLEESSELRRSVYVGVATNEPFLPCWRSIIRSAVDTTEHACGGSRDSQAGWRHGSLLQGAPAVSVKDE